MNRWRVETQILFAFTLALVVLAIVGALVYRAMAGFIDTSKAAAASQQALSALGDIDSALNQATAHERSYLILNDKDDLVARQAAVARINTYLADLDRLLSDDPQQYARLRILRRTVADRLLLFDQTFSGRRRSFSEIRQRLTIGPGLTLMRQIRNQVGQMEQAEMTRLTRRRTETERHLHETLTAQPQGPFHATLFRVHLLLSQRAHDDRGQQRQVFAGRILEEVVTRPGAHGFDRDRDIAGAGQHDHRRCVLEHAKLRQDFHAVQIGQVVIEQNDIGMMGARIGESIPGQIGLVYVEDTIGQAAERTPAGQTVYLVILYEQQAYGWRTHALRLLRHLADRPVAVNRAHGLDELLVVHGLLHVSGHPEVETLDLVLLLRGSREHDHRNAPQVMVAVLDHPQKLHATHNRHVDVEKDQTRPLLVVVMQVGKRFLAIFGTFEAVRDAQCLESTIHRHCVDIVVFDQQYGPACYFHGMPSVSESRVNDVCRKVKKKLLPWPGVDSIQIRPP